MSFADVYNAHLVIGSHPITYREIVGNVFGLASAVGGLRRRVWAWPVGIAGNVCLFTVFLGTAIGSSAGTPLLGQAGRQVFFIVTSVYGWRRWRATRRSDGGQVAAVQPRAATSRERVGYVAVAAVAVALCFGAFRAIGAGFAAPWWYYVADSWIFVMSMLATYSMARGWVDFWLMWVAVDAVGVPELLHFHYYPSAALYGIYGLFVIYGYFGWRRIARLQPPSDNPAVAEPTPVPQPTR
jgi:nicotinamide mononucleotide transporter